MHSGTNTSQDNAWHLEKDTRTRAGYSTLLTIADLQIMHSLGKKDDNSTNSSDKFSIETMGNIEPGEEPESKMNIYYCFDVPISNVVPV